MSTYTTLAAGPRRCATSCVLLAVGGPGADVDELRDALLHHPAHRALQEGAVFDGRGLDFWEGGFDGVDGGAVGAKLCVPPR